MMISRSTFQLVTVFVIGLSLTACVSTKTVPQTQVNDPNLGCASIATRIGEVRAGKNYAKANRGVSGANVVAALFFWPALLVNNSNTSQMIKSMDEREASLTKLYEGKDCRDTIPTYTNKEIKQKLKSNDTLESFS